MHKKASKTFIRQHDHSDCGVACLSSIINFHGGEKSLETLRQLSGTSKHGTTLLGIYKAAQKLGFTVEALEAEGVDNLNELNEPAILHVILDKRLQHYVVFYGFKNDKALIGEPGRGILYLTKEELSTIWESKAVLSLTPNADFVKKEELNNRKKEWVLNIIKQDRNVLIVSAFLGIVVTLLGLSIAVFSQKLIDDILPSENINKLILSLGLVTVLLFARASINFMRGYFLIRQAKDFSNRLILSFFGNLLRLPKSFFDNRKTGDMIARINDTRRIQSAISSLLGSLTFDLLTLIISLGFLFLYSWIIGISMSLCVPIFIVLAWYFKKPLFKGQNETMVSYAHSESNYVDTIQGINTIKAMNKETFFEQINKSIFGNFQEKIFALGKLGLRFAWSSEIIGVIFTTLLLGASSILVLKNQLRPGELVAVFAIAGSVFPSLHRLVMTNIQLQEARVAFDRMFEFITISPEYLDRVELKKIEDIYEVEVKDASFSFIGGTTLLKNISLKACKGEIISLLGECGIGKSTLLNLLQKFYNIEGGEILVNKQNLYSLNTHSWRDALGVVPQEIKIFNGTLFYNIALSNVKEDIEAAISFCKHFGLAHFFETLPQGYQTIIGEEGINLSGGQRQLVGLARALWRQPKLLLLDEPTSALDRKTEKVIMNIINELKKNMITIIVTHKIKTTTIADRIYILEDGVISSFGTPNELLKTSNLFSESLLEITSMP